MQNAISAVIVICLIWQTHSQELLPKANSLLSIDTTYWIEIQLGAKR